MTRYVDIGSCTAAKCPDDLRAASRVFGAAATLHIIRSLRLSGPQTRADIVSSTGVSAGQVGQSLNRLTNLKAVTTDPRQPDLPAGERVYSLNVERMDVLLDVLHSYITGAPAASTLDENPARQVSKG